VGWAGSDVWGQQTNIAGDLSDTRFFFGAAVSNKIAPEPTSRTKPARGNERLKIDFMVVSEFKRKRHRHFRAKKKP
jgi:hypothetical protein